MDDELLQDDRQLFITFVELQCFNCKEFCAFKYACMNKSIVVQISRCHWKRPVKVHKGICRNLHLFSTLVEALKTTAEQK